jgi:hypothetical protein
MKRWEPGSREFGSAPRSAEFRSFVGEIRRELKEHPPGTVLRTRNDLIERVERPPSAAALHEAGHAFAARQFDCDNVCAWVDRGGEAGTTHYTLPDLMGDFGRELDRIQTRAAISLAGYVAERLGENRDVPNASTILQSERGRNSPYSSELERLADETTIAFGGDRDTACRWFRIILPDARRRVVETLQRNWTQVLADARELDRKAATA